MEVPTGDQTPIGFLLMLATHTPLTARVHKGDWDKIVTPLQEDAWRRGLVEHPDQVGRLFTHRNTGRFSGGI